MSSVADLITVIRVAEAGPLWLVTSLLALLAAGMLYGALHCLADKRMIENVPTALVRSAAQGYSELRGMAELMAGDPIRAPASLRVCVWYRYQIEHLAEAGRGQDRRKTWVVVEHGTSDSLFHLTDTSGSCAVDPDGATVYTPQRDVWYGHGRTPGGFRPPAGNRLSRWFDSAGKSYRYTEQLIRPGDGIYVIGQFITHGGSGTAPIDTDDGIAERLQAWKRDQPALLREFDTNRDSHIDTQEWATLRARVAREARAERGGAGGPPPVDVIGQTRDLGRPYIIAVGDEEPVLLSRTRTALALMVLGVPLAMAVVWAWVVRLT